MSHRYELVVVAHGAARSGIANLLGPSDRLPHSDQDSVQSRRFLAGRSALLEAAARYTGDSVSTLVVHARCLMCGGSHGRPVVSGASATVHVSLTHAFGRAFAVASRVPVGVDAEPRDTSPARISAIRRLAGIQRGNALARWTAIEAVLKADGRGLEVDPSEVRVARFSASVADSGIQYRLHRHRNIHGCHVTVARATGSVTASVDRAARH